MMFPIFWGIVTVLYFGLPKKWRPAVLLVASYVFCGWIEFRALLVLLAVSLAVWLLGNCLDKMKNHVKAGTLAAASVCGCVFLLCFFKYGSYLLQRSGLEERVPETVLQSILMPVGLSFYMFQAIGYLMDIYKGESKAEKSFLYLSCYLAFFPKLVSGPIEREKDFIPQLKKLETVKFWNRGRLSTAFTYMLWGYFLKMVVADRLALTVGHLFEMPENFDSFWLFLGAFFYTVQIYCDFAGYSYIAIGCAGIFGIQLTQNFKAPYRAGSISDFWRRWHISLSSWLRDYLYIPLGGNRKGLLRRCLNTMVVFLVCGMWHGAGMNFAAWGLLHGIYLVVEILWKKTGRRIMGGRFFTFAAVLFAWIFFRAGSFQGAVRYAVRMLTAGIDWQQMPETVQTLQLSVIEIVIVAVGIIVVWAVDGLCDRKRINLPMMIQQKENTYRYLFFYLLLILIFIFGIYGPGYHTEQFIYMQF